MTRANNKELNIFKRYFPESSVLYCFGLWKELNFRFKIHRPRKTRYGDFRIRQGIPIITVNNDLNQYHFVITYIHEVAHLKTYNRYTNTVLPHGVEWKKTFIKLMKPILDSDTLPEDIARALNAYMVNPKASSCSDPSLMKVLSKYNETKSDEVFLEEIAEETKFEFDERIFVKKGLRRTRFECLDIGTNKMYLISKMASVRPIIE